MVKHNDLLYSEYEYQESNNFSVANIRRLYDPSAGASPSYCEEQRKSFYERDRSLSHISNQAFLKC
jgi:hypothetical protein